VTQQSGVVPVRKRLQLVATVNGLSRLPAEVTSAVWTCTSDSTLVLTSSSTGGILVAGTNATQTLVLNIEGNKLTAGTSYTFMLSITMAGATGTSSITVTANSPPRLGSVTMPSSVNALADAEMVVADWVDAEDNTPITYAFDYYDIQTKMYVGLGRASNQRLVATLPAGDASNGNQLTVRVLITDSLGDYTVVSQTVVVQQLDVTSAKNGLAAKLGQLAGNSEALFSYAGALGSSLAKVTDAASASSLRESLLSTLSTTTVTASDSSVNGISGTMQSLTSVPGQLSGCAVKSGATLLSSVASGDSSPMFQVLNDDARGTIGSSTVTALISSLGSLFNVSGSVTCTSKRDKFAGAESAEDLVATRAQSVSSVNSMLASVASLSSATATNMVAGEPVQSSTTSSFSLYTGKYSSPVSSPVSFTLSSGAQVTFVTTAVPASVSTIEATVAVFSSNPFSEDTFVGSGSSAVLSPVHYAAIRTAAGSTAAATTLVASPTVSFAQVSTVPAIISTKSAQGYKYVRQCVRWDDSAATPSWTANSCTTVSGATTSTSTVGCTCTQGYYFAVRYAEADCTSTVGGSSKLDSCGVCGGNGSSCSGSGTTTDDDDKKKLSAGAIVGIVIGSVAFVVIILVAVIVVMRRGRSRAVALEKPAGNLQA